jgi:hypothetical protein
MTPVYLSSCKAAAEFLADHADASMLVRDEGNRNGQIVRNAYADTFDASSEPCPFPTFLAWVNPTTAKALIDKGLLELDREVRTEAGTLVARVYKLAKVGSARSRRMMPQKWTEALLSGEPQCRWGLRASCRRHEPSAGIVRPPIERRKKTVNAGEERF